MICQRCNLNLATTHILDMSLDIPYQKHLCEKCKKSYSREDLYIKDLDDLIKKDNGLEISNKENIFLKSKNNLENDALQCEHCGITLLEIIEKGFLGCSNDFDLFSKKISDSLQQYHKNTHHVGLKPLNNPEQKKKAKIYSIEKQLDKAIKEENYEFASKLNKMLKETKE